MIPYLLYKIDEITHTIAVDGIPQANLRIHFIAIGDRNIAHVVANASDFEILRIMPGTCGAHPDGELGVNHWILPMADNDLCLQPHTRCNVSVFTIAMGRLI